VNASNEKELLNGLGVNEVAPEVRSSHEGLAHLVVQRIERIARHGDWIVMGHDDDLLASIGRMMHHASHEVLLLLVDLASHEEVLLVGVEGRIEAEHDPVVVGHGEERRAVLLGEHWIGESHIEEALAANIHLSVHRQAIQTNRLWQGISATTTVEEEQ